MKRFGGKIMTLLALVSMLTLYGCKKDDNGLTLLDIELEEALNTASGGQGPEAFILPESNAFNQIPQDPQNPVTAEKVSLGKLLYHETGLAINPNSADGTGTYSCASCHHAQAGFQAGRQQGIAEGGIGFGLRGEGRILDPAYDIDDIDVQPIRSPSALNIAYQTNILWNGQFGATGLNAGTEAQWTPGTPKAVNHLGYEGVETQAIAGLEVHHLNLEVDTDLMIDMGYRPMFEDAFPGTPPAQLITKETAGLAIAAYERTLLANRAPFQKWLKGNKQALSELEKQGAILFFGEANCVSCHNGPALSSMAFYALGMNDLDGPGTYGTDDPGQGANLGRGGFTTNADDNFKFKVPQLYNLTDSPFYGHGGTFTSVEDVVRYKNLAQSENAAVPAGQLANEFIPLNLSDEEITAITAFIDNGLRDAELTRYLPNDLPSGYCFPNNDTQSSVDLGCD